MEKGASVKEKLLAMRLGAADKILKAGLEESLSYMSFPMEHRIRTNNAMERLNREIRRRTRVVGNLPDGQSALMLAAARLRHVAATQWGTRRYREMDRFNNLNLTKEE